MRGKPDTIRVDIHSSGVANTASLILCPRKITHLGIVKKANWHQFKSTGDAGLHRIIFWSWLMMQSKYMPSDDLSINDGSVLFDEIWKPICAI